MKVIVILFLICLRLLGCNQDMENRCRLKVQLPQENVFTLCINGSPNETESYSECVSLAKEDKAFKPGEIVSIDLPMYPEYIGKELHIELIVQGKEKGTGRIKNEISVLIEGGKVYRYRIEGNYDEGFVVTEIK
ncbi:MAG: hypothetical protein RR700_00745 [Anaerorhabdus sp.]|uniref:hypothetical protein n=2 Tax=Anaerorhabdus sp. TaxID=1872524 RepID=UPI002FCAA224